jgi:Family of unknown function (DUF6624)
LSFDEKLQQELLAMEAEDRRVHTELAQAGAFDGSYLPRMKALHRANSARLREMIAAHGWPGRTLVGEDGAKAAWFILQHSISEPEFMRGCVPLLEASIAAGDAPAWHLAYVTDRIALYEGRPQRYGSQWDDDDGVSVLWDLEQPDRIDELRKSVGLEPWSSRLGSQRWQEILARKLSAKRRLEFDEWARATGWRK